MKKFTPILILAALVGIAVFATVQAIQEPPVWVGDDHRAGVPLPAKGAAQEAEAARQEADERFGPPIPEEVR